MTRKIQLRLVAPLPPQNDAAVEKAQDNIRYAKITLCFLIKLNKNAIVTKCKLKRRARNSSVSNVDAEVFDGTLRLENTKDVGMIWDSPTTINMHGNDKVNIVADKDSKYKIEE